LLVVDLVTQDDPFVDSPAPGACGDILHDLPLGTVIVLMNQVLEELDIDLHFVPDSTTMYTTLVRIEPAHSPAANMTVAQKSFRFTRPLP
jgi:hypothetical protein